MLKRRAVAVSLTVSLLHLTAFAQESERTKDINARIRKEGMEHSQIMKTMQV